MKMKKIIQNQQGVASLVMVGLIIVVLAAVGFGGYKVYQAGKSSKSDSQTKHSEEKPAELVATIEVSETTVKASTGTDFSNAETVTLVIKYTNNTAAPLADVKFQLEALGVATIETNTAKFNRADSAGGISVFDLADVAAQSTATATIDIIANQAGLRKISGTITTAGGKTASTNTVTFTAN